MMKIQTFRKFLWICLLLVSVAGYAQEAPESWMPDAALREAVRETLALPAGVPLTKDLMQDLDIFIAEGRGISDLTGLEYAINLREANLGDNSITDLRPLANLIHLEELGLPENRISDISTLAGLPNLVFLIISLNPISDLSPLAGLPKFRKLKAYRIWTTDFSPLEGLGLEIHRDEICEIAPFPPPVSERIQNRTFPSIALPKRTYWSDPNIYYDVAGKHDIHYFSTKFGLHWDLTPIASTEGLSTQLAGEVMGQVLSEYKKYALRNPNMLFFPVIRLHAHSDLDVFPPDSDFWLRDADGQIIEDDYIPWDLWMLDILNPEVQQLLIDRIVGVAECGYFSGVYFDVFAPYHIGVYEKHFNIGEEEVVAAYIKILKGIRERVRDDFLILVNRNRKKSPRYAEWINGSRMEIGVDYPGGYTYESLIGIENALSWNEKHLREPRINILEADGVVNQPPDGPDNLRWMRVFTTLSLTHSDGYSIFRGSIPSGDVYEEVPRVYQQYGDHTWYDFWDADLGRPVEEKGQRCAGCDGLFIREFTNGWAVYNRSGQPQKIQLPTQTTGVESGITSTIHIVPDLDGEMYLKQEPDTTGDGTVKVLALELVIEDLSEWMPDTALQAAVREALEELGLPASAPLTKEKMLQLTSLIANHSGIVDITGLEFAVNLEELYLGGRNRITDFSPLANLTHLTHLHIWHRRVENLPPVTDLDISPLSGLINLEFLVLERSGISDISPLAELINLDELSLIDNGISDISPLAGLKKLRALYLNHNQIVDFSPLAGLTNLETLHIDDNLGTDFSPLAALNLTDLHYDVDVNEDGVVNVLDLVVVANALGEADPDLNGDGVVNIQDLVIVANAF